MSVGISLRRPVLACAAATTAAIALTACTSGGEAPGESPSTSPATSPSADSGGDDGSTPGEGGPTPYEADESFDEPQQQELTAARAKKALPSRGDMPDRTWLTDISTFSDTPRVYDPAECAAIELNTPSARSFEKKHRSVEEAARFSQSDADGDGIIAVYVESFSQPYPLAYFDEAGEALASCGKFSWSKDGHSSSNTASSISLPLLGDRSFGVRIGSAEFDHRTDRLYVRSGHNLITVMRQSSKDDPYDERLLDKYAQAVLDNLEKSS